jgi:hypothetical protein
VASTRQACGVESKGVRGGDEMAMKNERSLIIYLLRRFHQITENLEGTEQQIMIVVMIRTKLAKTNDLTFD